MTQFNPITGAILVNQQLVTRQATAQTIHIKRTQDLQKNIAASGDRFESEVESTERMDPTHDEQRRREPQSRKKKGSPKSQTNTDPPPSLDIVG